MLNSYPKKSETMRALYQVFLTIVEANLKEQATFKVDFPIIEEFQSSFKKKIKYSKGIFIKMLENEVILEINVSVIQPDDFLSKLMVLQQNIFEEVLEMTGVKISAININVLKVLEKKKKTAE